MRLLYFFLFLIIPSTLKCQITVDHNFSDGYALGHKLENGELIFSNTTATGEAPNYSLTVTFYDVEYQQIGSTSFEASSAIIIPGYVSRNLFNADDDIEYTIQTGNLSEGTLVTRVQNMSGSSIFEIPNCTSLQAHNSNVGVKWMTICYGENPVDYHMRVYSLPGSLPSGLSENGNGEVLAYPNPTKSFINIPTEGASQIEVYNTMGQKVFEMPANGSSFQQVPTSQLAPGTYIYQTSSSQEVKPGKMFVVE